MRDLLDSFTSKLGSLGKRTVIIGAAVVVLVLIFIVSLITLTGGGGDGDGEEDFGEMGELMVFDQVGDDLPGGAGATVEERVAATMEAMDPTATPVPPTETPDIPATFQAEMEERRERAERVLKLNPLDRDTVRNPYLNDAELNYMSDMGGVLWSNTKAWMHVRRVLYVEVPDWSLELLEYHVSEARGFLEEAGLRENWRDYELGEIVEAYGRTVYQGMDGVGDAVGYLREAEQILGMSDSGLSSDLLFEDRERLGQLGRQAERSLGEFDDAMSRYGCSVCGELFRLRGR